MDNLTNENNEQRLSDNLRREAQRFRPEFSEALHERIVERLAEERRAAPQRHRARHVQVLAVATLLTAVSLAAVSLAIWWTQGPVEVVVVEPDVEPDIAPPEVVADIEVIPRMNPLPTLDIPQLAISRSVKETMHSLATGAFGDSWDNVDHDLDREARLAANRIMAHLPVEMILSAEKEQ